MIKCRTDDTSAFNTRTARRCLPRLDPARREGEVEEDSIQQQHNGMVVMEERGNPAGLRQAPTGEEEVSREGGRHQGLRYGCPPSPPLYIGAGERGEAQPCPFLQGRGAAKRGGGVHPPQGTSEVPSPFRTLPFFLYLGAWASRGWCPWPM